MINRRQFAGALAALGFPFVVRGATKPLLNLGLVADPQYADIPPTLSRYYRNSLQKLGVAVDHFNGLALDFCVNCGDTIDRDWASFDPVMKVFEKSKHKFHHVLGNHDFSLRDEDKIKAPARLGMEKKYYSVTKGDFCFLFLDTNDVSLYAYPAVSAEYAAAASERVQRAAAGATQTLSYNGAVGAAQMKWIEEHCVRAKEAGRKVLLFGHHPILPAGNNHNLWNPNEVVALAQRHSNVVGYFNGHNHAGGYDIANRMHFVTLHGMVETADTSAFGTLELHADRVVLTGQGRQPSREMLFRV